MAPGQRLPKPPNRHPLTTHLHCYALQTPGSQRYGRMRPTSREGRRGWPAPATKKEEEVSLNTMFPELIQANPPRNKSSSLQSNPSPAMPPGRGQESLIRSWHASPPNKKRRGLLQRHPAFHPRPVRPPSPRKCSNEDNYLEDSARRGSCKPEHCEMCMK